MEEELVDQGHFRSWSTQIDVIWTPEGEQQPSDIATMLKARSSFNLVPQDTEADGGSKG